MTTTTNSGNYVDFDEYVGLKLEKTQSTIRTTDLLTALAGVAAMFLGYLLLFVIFDQWILRDGFGQASRWVLLSTLIVATIAWLVWKVGIPSFRKVNGLFAARQIENAEPGLKSNLLNLIDLKAAGRAVNPAILKAMERRAAVRLQQVDVSNVIDHRPLVRTAYVLLAVIVLFCLYAIFSPKKISNSIWRGLLPAAKVPVSKRTEIVSVTPGDTTVPAHTPAVEVQVDLAGEIPHQVWLVYTSADGKFTQQPVELRPDDQVPTKFKGQLIGETTQGLMQDLTYSIRAGDAESEDYKLTVEQPPSAQIESIRIEFPAYMKLAPIEQQHHGEIDAWEGAKIDLQARTNMPIRSALVQFLDDPVVGPTGEEIVTTVKQNGRSLQADWTLALRSDGSYPKFYRIDCRTEDGRRDTSPANYGMTIRADQPPEVALVRPEQDIEAPINATVPLLIQAQDPDFELGYLYLNIERAGQKILHEQLSEGRQPRLTLKHDLQLSKLNVRQGEVLELWIEAYDNKQPRPNSRNTPKIKITVQEPVSRKQADQQLAAENQRIDDLLAEAERDQNPNPGEQSQLSEEDDSDRDRDRDNSEKRLTDPETTRQEKSDPEQQKKQEQNNQTGGDERQQSGDKKAGNGGQSETGQSGQGTQKERGQSEGTRKSEGGKDQSGQQPLNSDGSQDDEALKRLLEKFEQTSKNDAQDAPSAEGTNDRRDSQDKQSADEPSDSQAADQNRESQPQDDVSRDDGKNGADETDKNDAGATGDPTAERKPAPMPDKEDGRKPRTSEKDQEKLSGDEGTRKDGPKDQPEKGKEESSAEKEKGSKGRGKSPDKKPAGKQPDADESSRNPEQDAQKDRAETGSDPSSPNSKPDPKSEAPGGNNDDSPSGPTPADDANAGGEGKEEGDDAPSDSLNETSPQQNPSKNGAKSKPKGDGTDSSETSGEQEPAPESPDSIKKRADGSEQGTAKPDRDPKSNPDRVQNDKVKRDPREMPEKRQSQGTSEDSAQDPQRKTQKQNEKTDSTADERKTATPDSVKQSDEPSGDEKNSLKKPPKSDAGKKTNPERTPQQTPGDPSKGSDDKSDSSSDPAGAKTTPESETDVNEGSDSDSEPSSQESAEPKPESSSNSKSKSGDKAKASRQDPAGEATADQDSPAKEGEEKVDGESGPGKGAEGQKPGAPSSGGDKSADDAQGESDESSDQDKPAGKKPDANKARNGLNKEQNKEGAKAGDQPGEGKKSDQGQKSDQAGAGKGDGEEPGKGDSSGKPSTQPGSKTPGRPGSNPNGSGGAIGNDGDPSGPSGGEANPEAGDEVNLDYNKQATELVLQKLKKELDRGDVDPELLEQLGWTKTEMQQFADRLSRYLNESKQTEESPEVTARQQQFNEMLKNLNLQKSGSQRTGEQQPQREVIQIESQRKPVPPAYRSAYEKFTRDMARQKATGKK